MILGPPLPKNQKYCNLSLICGFFAAFDLTMKWIPYSFIDKASRSQTITKVTKDKVYPKVHIGTLIGWFKNPVSSQTEKLMAATKFSDYLGLNHNKKAKKLKHFIHLALAYRPQSFAS